MARAALFLEPGDLLQTRHLHADIAGGGRPMTGDPKSLKARLESHERGIISETLARHDGHVRSAAGELKVGRTTLYRRMSELGIAP